MRQAGIESLYVRVSINGRSHGSLGTRRTREVADELVWKVPRAIDAKNEHDHIGAHLQQNVEHRASGAHVTVPSLVPELLTKHNQ